MMAIPFAGPALPLLLSLSSLFLYMFVALSPNNTRKNQDVREGRELFVSTLFEFRFLRFILLYMLYFLLYHICADTP